MNEIDEKKPARTEAAPVAVTTETKTVEAWATAKGYLPQIFPGGTLATNLPGNVRSVSVSLGRSAEIAPRPNPSYFRFAAAKVMNHWPEGLVMTEADFDKAVHAATDGTVIR